jgi:hypothetical protein
LDPECCLGFRFALQDGLHIIERNELGSGTTLTLHMTGEHRMLTGAGWSYRSNERGWIIYRVKAHCFVRNPVEPCEGMRLRQFLLVVAHPRDGRQDLCKGDFGRDRLGKFLAHPSHAGAPTAPTVRRQFLPHTVNGASQNVWSPTVSRHRPAAWTPSVAVTLSAGTGNRPANRLGRQG